MTQYVTDVAIIQPECERRRGQQLQEAHVPTAKTILFITLTEH